jgi:integral membrane protein
VNDDTVQEANKPDLRRLRLLAFIEGASLLVLVLVAVPLKHFGDLPIATQIVGPVHGLAFLAYVVYVFDALGTRRITGREAGLAVLSALLPGGSFLFARSIRHR